MSEAIRRMGVAYGKLGMSTDAELIKRRAEGVGKAADELNLAGVAPLLEAVFDIGSGDARYTFLAAFKDDPTFNVRPGDQEGYLLAGAIADLAMEGDADIAGHVALATLACACSNLRQPARNDELISIARTNLAEFQGNSSARPGERKYLAKPDTLETSFNAVTTNAHPQFQTAAPHVIAALNAVADYAAAVARYASRSDSELLAYIASLEDEMRVHWWVTGGWSTGADKPFRQLGLDTAALLAGEELAAKNANAYGLFAAPALLDLILERGRSSTTEDVVLANAVRAVGSGWRKAICGSLASGPLAAILPVTTALGLSAESDDADDWKPRFKRMAKIDAETTMSGADLALQFYRERVVARALG